MSKLFFATLLLVLALASHASADALFMSCPTVLTADFTNITANTFINTPPRADCGTVDPIFASDYVQCNIKTIDVYRLNVTVDGLGDDVVACTCDNNVNPGVWKITISSPVQKEYNITAEIWNLANTVSARQTCMVKRANFQGNFVVPEFNPVFLPLIMLAAILVLRKRKKSK
ncbi:hypothetical protein HY989_01630 [Candidatus Micrarchaeota archaeon]|nr:hypothetical protein [Candidatus Micrarchaeota archaeon]